MGDHRQLPELQAGGTFRALVQRGLALELRENVRQVHAWEREALDQLRDGEAEHALGAYVRHDRVIVEPTADATRARLVEDWFAAGDPGRAVMIANRRVDVADLNSRARERMRAAGQLGPEIETPAGSFAVGDHVVIKRNDHRREINNGDRGRVIHVDPMCGAIGIDLRCRRIQLDRRFLAEPTAAGDPPLMHAYAITGHIAQGLTVEGTYVLATDGIDREWTYVALSRGRNSNRLYLSAEADNDRAEYAPVGPTPDPLERLARQLERSSAQVLAIDSGQRIDSVSLDQATRERQRLEQRRFGWLPTRRQELEAARAREADVRRELLERQHGGRPFATDAEWRERLDRQHERELERATDRLLRRERGMGREL